MHIIQKRFRPEISIIVATYNSERTIEQCLEAITAQKDIRTELIIVDGGSGDSTLDIISDFRAQVDVLISEPDHGVYDAWNKGIHASAGDWIMFVGSDDYLNVGVLDCLHGMVDRSVGIDYISGKVMLIDTDGIPLRIIGKPFNWKKFCKYMVVAHVGSLHSRRLYNSLGLYNTEFKICGDYEFLLRAGPSLRAEFVDIVIAKMTVGGVSSENINALVETFSAKRVNGARIMPLAMLDMCWAVFKLWIRRLVIWFR